MPRALPLWSSKSVRYLLCAHNCLSSVKLSIARTSSLRFWISMISGNSSCSCSYIYEHTAQKYTPIARDGSDQALRSVISIMHSTRLKVKDPKHTCKEHAKIRMIENINNVRYRANDHVHKHREHTYHQMIESIHNTS